VKVLRRHVNVFQLMKELKAEGWTQRQEKVVCDVSSVAHYVVTSRSSQI